MSDQPAVGVCWFDDPESALGGWACRAGDKPFRVNGTQSLASDVFWITNLHYNLFRRFNLVQAPHIADTQFFRTSLQMLANELGLYQAPDRAVEVLASIFARVVIQGDEHLGIGRSPSGYRYMKALMDRLLPREHRMLPHGAHAHELQNCFRQAMQANQGMSGVQRPAGAVAYSFVFPRGAYARWLLSQPVPCSAAWQEIKTRGEETVFGVQAGENVSGTRAIRARLQDLGEGHAVFLRIRVLDMDPFYQPFASFGATAKCPRAWAALPEVLELSRYAKIAVAGGFRAPAAPLNLQGLDLEADEFSFSRGLYAENVWAALTQKLNNGKDETALGAYLRAYDRLACGRAAAAMARMRYLIGSYGTGRVLVYLRAGEMREAAKYALELGLLPPLSMLEAE